ncbi:MAG: single-stranded DNA-binding protein [Armatimonadota bacterium]
MSVNRVVLIGRLTRDPELRTTNSGKNVVDFSIAVQKRIKPQDGAPDADFFRIKAWGQTADYVNSYLQKGRLVAVDGRLETRKWTDQNGTNRESVEVVADNVNGLDRPRDEAGGNAAGGSYAGGNSGGGAGAPAARPVSAAPSEEEYDPFADE